MSAREKYVRQWLEKADEDRRAMDRLMEGDPIMESACFHAQQCAEKALKGFLTAHDRHVEKTHDLNDILELCAEIEPTFEQFEQMCDTKCEHSLYTSAHLVHVGPHRHAALTFTLEFQYRRTEPLKNREEGVQRTFGTGMRRSPLLQ